MLLSPEWEERELREMQAEERKRLAEAVNRGAQNKTRDDEFAERHRIDDADRRDLQASGEAMAAAIHAADVEANGPPEPLGMAVPAWWDTWQSFLVERDHFRETFANASHNPFRRDEMGRQNTGAVPMPKDHAEIAQDAYERGWRDAVKRVEVTILASLHGLD